MKFTSSAESSSRGRVGWGNAYNKVEDGGSLGWSFPSAEVCLRILDPQTQLACYPEQPPELETAEVASIPNLQHNEGFTGILLGYICGQSQNLPLWQELASR